MGQIAVQSAQSKRDGALPGREALCPGRAEHPDNHWRYAETDRHIMDLTEGLY